MNSATRSGLMDRAEVAQPQGLEREFAGLDALQVDKDPDGSGGCVLWNKLWPPLAAVIMALFIWQAVVWSGWKDPWVLAPPAEVFKELGIWILSGEVFGSIGATLKRAALGYGFSLVVGGIVGLAVSQSKILRRAVGSLISGLQTMPSIAWFPLAILLFQLSEATIFFVVVLGAAPSVANGLISGIDHVPPVLLRAGKVMGARGLAAYRYVIVPAALPSFISGLKQAWAFSWRSLMAAEIILGIGFPRPLGAELQLARDDSDAPRLIATMIVILLIGIIVDSAIFGRLTQAIRRRYGLIDAAA
ncbi:MAG: ABC transporter permease [Actinomycetota bacterium]